MNAGKPARNGLRKRRPTEKEVRGKGNRCRARERERELPPSFRTLACASGAVRACVGWECRLRIVAPRFVAAYFPVSWSNRSMRVCLVRTPHFWRIPFQDPKESFSVRAPYRSIEKTRAAPSIDELDKAACLVAETEGASQARGSRTATCPTVFSARKKEPLGESGPRLRGG